MEGCNLGDYISIQLQNGDTKTGYLFSDLPQLLVLQSMSTMNDISFSMYPKGSIVSVCSGDSSDMPRQMVILPECDKVRARQREEEAVNRMKQQVNNIGQDIPANAQVLFNAIQNLYSNTVWEGQDIVVMNDVVIKPPYGPENCEAVAGRRANTRLLNRIKQVAKAQS
eukprot:TRINITY_DN6469_c0_g1_i1.p1 TRINITY_DN6469_c0_g1~~TRINITY_DN6469_c0_g1_i1.p1  ORF type:complete len:168 (-),score=40.05 TRINITY_DN6469_c0_g1_i1:52-555(-)